MSQSEADDYGYRGTNEGTKLKATSGWRDNENGTDDFGFSALPRGFRNDYYGFFANYRNNGFWWSSTTSDTNNAWNRILSDVDLSIMRTYYPKDHGISVRCVRGN
ncbi:MAG: FISUMP domain-containing protein [Mariniphaga sp.]|nr:FISUMP domain-containing protein [Mariniphaga sp.]MDD4226345.1 FISUMP domain-containing protein [Mariniphaga sp.]MDD4424980.1 FISUMP domain-containing protein [Mariniphaga sp.]